jgi:tol-pal system protein YbgF
MARLIQIFCLVLLLAGCVQPPQAQIKMESDFEEMKRRLARLEQNSSDGGSQARGQLEALGRQGAEIQAGLDTLRVEFQSINGRLDDLGRSNEQLAADLALTRDDLGMQLAALTERLNALETKVPKNATEPVTSTAPAKPQGSGQNQIAPEQLYQQSLSKILGGTDFAAGRAGLESFIQNYPQHELAINARYWVGEAYYGEKKFENAILKFQEVIQLYSDHPKAASALLKQGMAFDALGDRANAKTVWNQLIKNFPLAPEAEKAKQLVR